MELAGVTLGLREGVVVLITLVVLYIVFVLLRMYRLHNRPPAPPDRTPPSFAPEAPPAAVMPPPTEPQDVPEAWAQTSSGMAEDLLRRGLEQEVQQLRDEVDALRGELAALRDDMHRELAHLRSSQTVSPIYGDAMQMAAAGYDPATIAERCGIARAEAELVVALAKSQER